MEKEKFQKLKETLTLIFTGRTFNYEEAGEIRKIILPSLINCNPYIKTVKVRDDRFDMKKE